jgi:hypothetical protein
MPPLICDILVSEVGSLDPMGFISSGYNRKYMIGLNTAEVILSDYKDGTNKGKHRIPESHAGRNERRNATKMDANHKEMMAEMRTW